MICYAVPGHPELVPVINAVVYAANSGNLVPLKSISIIISLCTITFPVSFLSLILTLNTLITSFLQFNNLFVAFQASFLKTCYFTVPFSIMFLQSCFIYFLGMFLQDWIKGCWKWQCVFRIRMGEPFSIMQLLQERPMCPSILWSKSKLMMSIWKMGGVLLLSLPLFC